MKPDEQLLYWLAALAAIIGLCGWRTLSLKRETLAAEARCQPVRERLAVAQKDPRLAEVEAGRKAIQARAQFVPMQLWREPRARAQIGVLRGLRQVPFERLTLVDGLAMVHATRVGPVQKKLEHVAGLKKVQPTVPGVLEASW